MYRSHDDVLTEVRDLLASARTMLSRVPLPAHEAEVIESLIDCAGLAIADHMVSAETQRGPMVHRV